jgi:small-conductance mechanosensitive channel
LDLFHAAFPVAKDVLNLPVFPTGKHHLTLWMVMYLLILLSILLSVTNFVKRWLIDKILVRFVSDRGVRYTLGAIFSYVVLTVGLLIILDTAGIDITIITVIAGALGIGLSLSLQNICANCFGGLLILIERPIKVGDRIQVGDTVGEVADIALRATTVMTKQNTAVIVPNTDFVSSKVVNLSYGGGTIRCSIPIVLPSSEDPEVLINIVERSAKELSANNKDKPVQVLLQSFTNDTINLLVYVWTDDRSYEPEVLQSELNRAVAKELRKRVKAAGAVTPAPMKQAAKAG